MQVVNVNVERLGTVVFEGRTWINPSHKVMNFVFGGFHLVFRSVLGFIPYPQTAA